MDVFQSLKYTFGNTKKYERRNVLFYVRWSDKNGKMKNKLKSVAMLTVSKDICNLPGNFDSAVDETHMCAGVNEKEGGVCTDDKGGSLICSEDCKSLCL